MFGRARIRRSRSVAPSQERELKYALMLTD